MVRDGETGLLVDEGDVDGIARHMKLMIESPSLAAEIGAHARAHVRAAHSMATSIAGLMSVIEGAVALQGAGSAGRD